MVAALLIGEGTMSRPPIPVYSPPLSPMSAAQAAGVRNLQQSIRLGNTVRIRPNGAPFAPDDTTRPLALLGEKLLLDVDLTNDAHHNLPGSWVLTLRARITDPSAAPGYVGFADRIIAPIVARVTMGSGGSFQDFDVDAWRGSFAIPAAAVRVAVGYSQVLNPTAPGTAGFRFLPTAEVEVTGFLHRTLETGLSVPTRSIFVSRPSTTPTMPIPKGAVAWTYLPLFEVTAADVAAGYGSARFRTRDGVISTLEQVGRDLFAQNGRMHCFRDLHPIADVLDLQLDATINPLAADRPGTLIFQLGF